MKKATLSSWWAGLLAAGLWAVGLSACASRGAATPTPSTKPFVPYANPNQSTSGAASFWFVGGDTLLTRAKFDLGCEADSLSATVLESDEQANPTVVGVKGCNVTGTYVRSHGLMWLLNSSTRPTPK